MDPRETFYVNSYATGWWWYPNGRGFLYCFDHLLRFEYIGLPLMGRLFKAPSFEHTDPRALLVTPTMPLPDHYTIVVFEHGKVSVSIPGRNELVRATLAACGFEIIEVPPRRSWPRKHQELWNEYCGPS